VSAGGAPAPAAPALRRPGRRPLLREERQLAALWGVAAVSSLLLRPVWLALAPLLPACPFRALTGVPCLSCGTTRAAAALLEGRVVDALSVNPLAALAGIAFAAGGLVAALWAALDLPVPRLPRVAPRAMRAGLALLLAVGWAWVIVVQR
jgi:hypothetical protein